MRALITGINGFVGGFLTEHLLREGIEVWGTDLAENNLTLTNCPVNYRQLNIADSSRIEDILTECVPDYIFHLAAQSSAAFSWKNPQLTMDININGTINLLESVRKLGQNPRILLVGSSEEYGFVNSEDMPVAEGHGLNPGNPYAVSKIAQTLLGQVYARSYHLNIIMVRAFNHIGPKQSPTFVVPDFAKRIAEIEKGKREPVLRVGNLEAERDFTDVRDIVAAYYGIIEYGIAGETYNVGSGRVYKIQHLLDCLLSYTNANIRIEKDPERMRPSDVPIIYCDNRKIRKLIDWQPYYKIEDTLLGVLDYWREAID